MNKDIQSSLTEDIIKESCLLYDIPYDTVKKIGGFENFVYEYTKNNQSFIIRYTHSSHRTKDQVYAELEFIDYLDQNNARVSTVIHSINNELLETIPLDELSYFIICVFEKAPGTFVTKEDLTSEFYEMFGEEVGRLHRLTKTYQPKHKRIHYYEEPYLQMSTRCLKQQDHIINDRYYEILEKIEKLPKNKDNYGLIHTDLHFGNMFYSSGELTFFDFDDASYKHFISDIAIIIYYHFMRGNPTIQEVSKQTNFILTHFCKGYKKQNTIDMSIFHYLNDFLMLRSIILYVVIHDAGEEVVDSAWGKQFIDKNRDKIINRIPFLDLDIALEGIKWSL